MLPSVCLAGSLFHPPQCEVFLERGGAELLLHEVRLGAACPPFARCLWHLSQGSGEAPGRTLWGFSCDEISISSRGLDEDTSCSSMHNEHSTGLTKVIQNYRYSSRKRRCRSPSVAGWLVLDGLGHSSLQRLRGLPGMDFTEPMGTIPGFYCTPPLLLGCLPGWVCVRALVASGRRYKEVFQTASV